MKNGCSQHGALSVRGTRLVDSHGIPFRLYGMSTHGVAWHPKYICGETFSWLRNSWGANCIRLALYPFEYGGYCTGGDPAELKRLIVGAVNTAIELDMYVIIDWHVLNEQDPMRFADQAVGFFQEMSLLYAGCPNVIYEICNEPNGDVCWQDIFDYAQRVIPAIRENSPDSLVIVGTPHWSQKVDAPFERLLPYRNIMYALHFYAATHGEYLRRIAKDSIDHGLPVFISEFGICDCKGQGELDYVQAAAWRAFADHYGLSFIMWNLSDSDESCSIIRHGCPKLSDWSEEELTGHGRWIAGWIKEVSAEDNR